jgi:HD-like signal output (HDOD) protein
VSQELTKEARLEACIRQIAGADDLPVFAHDIHELMTTAADEDASLRQVTNIILKSVSLSSKLLRTVNSVYFNRSDKPILSVSHAVILLGWDTIRDLASSLMLFEKFMRKAPGVKELMLLSLLTANQARRISIRAHYLRAEEAYLCGMFSGLGELLVACYLPEEYSEILTAIKERKWKEQEACQHILRFSYEELGQAMIRHWHLPEKVAHGMERVERLSGRGNTPEERLALITAFSHSLSQAVYRLEPQEGRERVKFLAKKFGPLLSVEEGQVEEILKSTVADAQVTFAAANIPFDNLRLARQIENALSSELSEPTILPAEAATAAPSDGDLARLTQEIKLALESGEIQKLNEALLMVLEAIYRGAGFDRVLFCLIDPSRAHLQARTGLGPDVEAAIPEFQFPASAMGGPLGAALGAKQDLFVDQVAGSRYSYADVIMALKPHSFGLLPLVVNDAVIGCLYFDRRAAPLGLEEKQKRLLQTLRDHLRNMIAVKKKNA